MLAIKKASKRAPVQEHEDTEIYKMHASSLPRNVASPHYGCAYARPSQLPCQEFSTHIEISTKGNTEKETREVISPPTQTDTTSVHSY